MGDGAGTLGKVCWCHVVADQAWVARGRTGLSVDSNVKRQAQTKEKDWGAGSQFSLGCEGGKPVGSVGSWADIRAAGLPSHSYPEPVA